MSESKGRHTATPWAVSAAQMNRPAIVIEQVGGTFLAQTVGGNDEANAARIVACVNALEGLNPEAIPELMKTLAAIARQRPGPADLVAGTMRELAEDALKKVKP